MPLLVLDSVVCGNECVMPKTSTLMMLIVILAAQMEITVTIVTLSQVQLAGLEVLMGAGCIWQSAALRRLGCLLCKPCSTCSTGQQKISGSIYFNKPNDTSISLKRNVKGVGMVVVGRLLKTPHGSGDINFKST